MKRNPFKQCAALLLWILLALSLSLPAFAGESLVKITKPANKGNLSVGKNDLYVSCVNVNPNGGFSAEQGALYTPLKIRLMRDGVMVKETSLKFTQLNFTAAGAKVGTIEYPESGIYTLSIQAPGSTDVWDTVTVYVGNARIDTSEWGLPVGTDPSSGMNRNEIPGFVPDEENPGYRVVLGTTNLTIDLAKKDYARLGFKKEFKGQNGFYCDWPEDQDHKIIKYKAMGDDYIEYSGVSVGTTRLHIYCMIGGKRYNHQVVTFNVIDSSKPNNGLPTSNKPGTSGQDNKPAATTPAAGNAIISGNTYVITGSDTVTFKKAKAANAASLTVPATVKYNNKTYKVTAIASQALAKNQNLTSVVIGKNVQSIGSKAFYGCKNLKKLTIKSKNLSAESIGSAAFKGISTKAIVRVPKAKKAAYKTLLRKKGLSAKATVN